jgi:hypothetical protein
MVLDPLRSGDHLCGARDLGFQRFSEKNRVLGLIDQKGGDCYLSPVVLKLFQRRSSDRLEEVVEFERGRGRSCHVETLETFGPSPRRRKQISKSLRTAAARYHFGTVTEFET